MGFGKSLDVNSPDGLTESPRLGDNRIQETREGFRERLDVDHYFPANDPTAGLVDNAETGEHRQLTFRETTAPALVDPDKIVLYGVLEGTHCGLAAEDEDENVKVVLKQKTGGGALVLNIDAADLAEAGAAIVDDDTIELAAGVLQLKDGGATTGVLFTHVATDGGQFVDGTTLEIHPANGIQVKGTWIASRLGQSSQVVGTTDISNTTGDWADMADMSIDFTPNGGAVLVMFSASIRMPGGTHGEARLLIDGAQKVATKYSSGSSGTYEHVVVLQWIETGLSGSPNVIKIQWKDTAGTVYQDGTTHRRVLQAIELPA